MCYVYPIIAYEGFQDHNASRVTRAWASEEGDIVKDAVGMLYLALTTVVSQGIHR